MSYLTYILPVLAAAFCITAARRWMPLFSDGRLPSGPDGGAARPRFSFESRNGRITGLDAVLCIVISVCYAATAFAGLGDTTAPQSWCRFTARGQYALVDLGEEVDIGMIRYYTGMHTGEYRLQFSDDGESWRDAGTLEQQYNDLLQVAGLLPRGRGRGGRLGALYTPHRLGRARPRRDRHIRRGGQLCSTRRASSYDAGCAPLFDEQDTVPVRPGT